jgi:hypothetical protein
MKRDCTIGEQGTTVVARWVALTILSVLAAAVLAASGTAARAVPAHASTSGPYVQYFGLNAACSGLTTPVWFNPSSGSIVLSSAPSTGSFGPFDLYLQTDMKVSTSYGPVPEALRRELATPGLPAAPAFADLTWTRLTASGYDGAGVPFTVSGHFARLTSGILSNDLVGAGTLTVTRGDQTNLVSYSAVAYEGSRSAGVAVYVSGGRCSGPEGSRLRR